MGQSVQEEVPVPSESVKVAPVAPKPRLAQKQKVQEQKRTEVNHAILDYHLLVSGVVLILMVSLHITVGVLAGHTFLIIEDINDQVTALTTMVADLQQSNNALHALAVEACTRKYLDDYARRHPKLFETESISDYLTEIEAAVRKEAHEACTQIKK